MDYGLSSEIYDGSANLPYRTINNMLTASDNDHLSIFYCGFAK